MTLNLVTLRDKLRIHTGEDDTDLDDTACDLLLNQSYWEVMDKFNFREKERRASFTLVAGTRDYEAPTPFEALQHIAVVDLNGQHQYLRRMTPAKYEEEYSDDTEGNESTGIPTHYVRRQNRFTLYPTPDEAYGAVIYYWTTLADLEEGVVEEPELPQVWHEILLYGAVYRRLMELGDYTRAKEVRGQQGQLIGTTSAIEEKEETDSRYSGIDLPPELTEI